MKLKYYLRGLGIGIILITLIFSISGNKEKLSNKEIISRAEKLGMVMWDEQPSISEAPAVSPVVTGSPEITESPDITGAIDATITPSPTKKPDMSDAVPTVAPKPTDKPIVGTSKTEITFTIEQGMSSGKVALLLFNSGLVDNADKFNEYVVQVGKADVIKIGKFTVEKGASYSDIMKVITN